MCIVGPAGSGVSSLIALWAARMYNTHCVGRKAGVSVARDLGDVDVESLRAVDLNDLDSMLNPSGETPRDAAPPLSVHAPLPFISVARTSQHVAFDNHEVRYATHVFRHCLHVLVP